jgi:PmbA protein
MDILEELMRQAEQAEVVNIQSESTKIGFEANRLKTSQVEETQGIAVRVVKGGRLGFAASSDEWATEKLLSNALESAAYGDQVPIVFPAPQPAPEVTPFDQTIAGLSIPRMVEIGREIVDLFLQIEPNAQVNVGLERDIQHQSIRNHAGTEVSFRRSPLTIGFSISRVEGDDMLRMGGVWGMTVWEDDYLALARGVGEKFELGKKSATISSGRMPVLFAPTAMVVLGLPLRLGLDGKNVYMRTSPMAGKVGEKLFDDKITIVDDPTLDGGVGSAPYDDEGVAHRRNVLVERGVLKGFMYDLKTAAQTGVASTGNGARDLFNAPSPGPTNLLFQASDTPLADIIASMDEGLLVERILGLQGNVISGAFSNLLDMAFKIEKGEIVGRVKDVSIAGDVYDHLQDVTAISRETGWFYLPLWYRQLNAFSFPYILLPDMNVVTKQ